MKIKQKNKYEEYNLTTKKELFWVGWIVLMMGISMTIENSLFRYPVAIYLVLFAIFLFYKAGKAKS